MNIALGTILRHSVLLTSTSTGLLIALIAPEGQAQFSIQIDATGLRVPGFAIDSGAFVDSTAPQQFALASGTHAFHDNGGNSFIFDIDSGGAVTYDASLEVFLDGAGTTNLVVEGLSFTYDATALSVPGVQISNTSFVTTSVVQTFTGIPGEYVFHDNGGNLFTFTFDINGVIDHDPSLGAFLSGAGTSNLVVEGLSFTYDATALSVPGVQISNTSFVTTSVVQTFTGIPGEYVFHDNGGNLFTFTFDINSVIDYDPSLGAFLSGAGTSNLVVEGLSFTYDATALSVPGVQISNTSFVTTSVVQTFTGIPGEYVFHDNGGNLFTFTFDINSVIDYDPSLGAFLSGAGTSNLVVEGLSFAYDATALSVPGVAISNTSFVTTSVVQTFTGIPGEYVFHDNGGNLFNFSFDINGVVDYDPSRDPFLEGAGTSSLIVQGLAVSIDATALIASTFAVSNIGGFDAATSQPLTGIPGSYTFSTSVFQFQFLVLPDGKVDFAAELDGAILGRGTSTLTVLRNPFELDDDGDGVANPVDNCPQVSNPGQLDQDGDLVGDVCDNCPATANTNQTDADADGMGDFCDNCPAAPNTDQADTNNDGFGDACVDPTTTIPDTADVSPTATIGSNTQINQNVTVEDHAQIGDDVVLNQGSTVGQGASIGDGTNVNQNVSVGAGAIIGMGVTISQGVYIGPGAVIGDDAFIGRDTVICDGAEIGAGVNLGRNVLVEISALVPAGAIVPKQTTVPGVGACSAP